MRFVEARGRPSIFILFCVLGVAAASGGCAQHPYSGFASLQAQELVAKAQAGDRAAKFALAGRLERGEGVARNWSRAKLLYAEVARASGGSWLPPAKGRGPIRVGATEDDLARAARARLGALARSADLRLRWTVIKGRFDAIGDYDDAGIDAAARACHALNGEFAALVEPRPLPGCGFKGFRRHGSDRVYATVTYNEAEDPNAVRQENNGDTMPTARLSLWPIPISGECGVYNAVELIKGRDVVATILVSEKQPRDKDCHTSLKVHDPNIF